MSSDKPNDAPAGGSEKRYCWLDQNRTCSILCAAFHEGGRPTTCEFLYLLGRIERHVCPPLPTAAPPRVR